MRADRTAFSTDEAARHLNDRMVARLVEDGLLRTPRLRRAFRDVLRHHFLPGAPLGITYGGEAVPTRRDADGIPLSSAIQPALMAAMLEQLGVQEGERILEIGTGTGYNAALLAHLAGPTGAVTSLELHPEVVAGAREHLAAAGQDGVEVVVGDGWDGYPPGAPYDRIEVTVGAWDVAPQWLDQLGPGGVLAVPLWVGAGLHLSALLVRDGPVARSRSVVPCGFMRMLEGPNAGPVGPLTVNGWVIASERSGPDELAALARLLAVEPTWRGARSLPEGWFLRLLRHDPRAVQLAAPGQRRYAAGLLCTDGRSLAVVEGNEVLVYGEGGAEAGLLAHLEGCAPLRVDTLEVLAVPNGGDATVPDGCWLLERPGTLLALRDPAGAW